MLFLLDTGSRNVYNSWNNPQGQARSLVSAMVQLVEYRTRNQEVAGSTHTLSTASNLEQVANLLVCSGRLSLLPSVGREMSSSYGYGVKA